VKTSLIHAALVLAAVASVTVSPFGRRTLREVGRDGLMVRHVRHLVHAMTGLALLVAVAATLSLR
jgi:hypothetical protein